MKDERITVCHRIEHLMALDEISSPPKLPRESKRKTKRPEPSWALTRRTCKKLPKDTTQRKYIPANSTSVDIEGCIHLIEWHTSKVGKPSDVGGWSASSHLSSSLDAPVNPRVESLRAFL